MASDNPTAPYGVLPHVDRVQVTVADNEPIPVTGLAATRGEVYSTVSANGTFFPGTAYTVRFEVMHLAGPSSAAIAYK